MPILIHMFPIIQHNICFCTKMGEGLIRSILLLIHELHFTTRFFIVFSLVVCYS